LPIILKLLQLGIETILFKDKNTGRFPPAF
jgi:hypothetical protein